MALEFERHFYRCLHCCNVFAIDGPRQVEFHGGRKYYSNVFCDCGGGAWAKEGRSSCQWIGRVEQDYAVREEERCACDDRCTSARGPKCSCTCGGKNHGTHAVRKVVVRENVSRIVSDDLPKRLADLERWEAACAQAREQIDAHPAVISYRARVWLPRNQFDLACDLVSAIRRASKLNTISGRIKALNKSMSAIAQAQPA